MESMNLQQPNYVVAVVSLFDNEMKIEFVHADNEIEALNKHSDITGFDFSNCVTLDEALEQLFNGDVIAGVKQL